MAHRVTLVGPGASDVEHAHAAAEGSSLVVRTGAEAWRALRAMPHIAAVEDLAGPAGLTGRIRRIAHHIEPGGEYVVRRVGGAPGQRQLRQIEQLARVIVEGNDPDLDLPASRAERYDLAFARAFSGVELDDGAGAAVFTRSGQVALLKVADDDDVTLEARTGAHTVLEIPGTAWNPVGQMRATDPGFLETAAMTAAPRGRLREVDDVVCYERQVVVKNRTVLPCSFRAPTARRLRNVRLADLTDEMSSLWRRYEEPARLPGTFYHLDSEVPNHFGHAVTETVSRLWAVPEARRRHPDLRFLLVESDRGEYGDWFYRLLELAGVERSRLTVAPGPVMVDRLLTASPLYCIGEYAHEAVNATYDLMSRSTSASPSSRFSRVFFTRDSDRRACHNRTDVETFFGERGFVVVRPEDLSMDEQIAMVQAADVIAGFGGSALLHLGFTPEPKTVIAICSETYHLHNEIALTGLRGHSLHVVVCEADVPNRSSSFDPAAYRSSFSVDLVDAGPFIDRAIGDSPRT